MRRFSKGIVMLLMTNTWHKKLLAISVTALLLTGCSKRPEQSTAIEPTPASVEMAASTAAGADASSMATAQAKSDTESTASQTGDNLTLGSAITTQETNNLALANKKLLVTANASFQAQDVQQTVNQIEQLTLKHGSYITNSEIINSDSNTNQFSIGNYQLKQLTSYTRQATMLVRVPKAQVTSFLQQLQQYIAFLDHSQFNAKDVTLELQKAQVEARIAALKTDQLATQRADKTTQTGNINVADQTALARQQQLYADLERQGLQDAIALSSIELTFSQPEKIREQVIEDIDGKMRSEQSTNFLPRLWDNLKAGWLYFVEFLLLISQFWSFIVGAILVWWLWCLFTRWLDKWRAERGIQRHRISQSSTAATRKDDNTPPDA